MSHTPLIEITNLTKRYPKQTVLENASLTVEKGELLCITGRSGSGKSTLLHLMSGLDREYEGSIHLFGLDLNQLSEKKLSRLRNESIGFVFQSFHLLDHLTCRENVLLPYVFSDSNMTKSQAEARADEVLTQLGLFDHRFKRPVELSGGQRQRVAIARAIFFRPTLLLCDEPTGNLDSTTAHSIIELFLNLNKQGLTLIIVTHDDRLLSIGKRVLDVTENHAIKQRSV